MTRRAGRAAVAAYLVVSTVFVLVAALLWYVSPMALGFGTWPEDERARSVAHGVYQASYYVGIPGLLVAQGIAIVLSLRGRSLAAVGVSAVAIVVFLAVVGWVNAQVR